MTTINVAREAIYQRFVDEWDDETTYTFENESFDPEAETEWVRLVVRNTASQQETLGPATGREFLRRGSILIQVFTEFNKGTARADALCELLRTIFEGVTFSGIRCYNVLVRENGQDGKWNQSTVEVLFDYNQTK